MAQPAPPQIPAATAQALLDQLRKHLESELAVQRRLLGIAEQLGPRLIAGDAPAIAALIAQEAEPAREAARLRSVRERLAKAIGAVFQIEGEVTVSRILARASESLRLELVRLRTELTQVCQRLGRQAERNLVVARQGLALIRDVMGQALGVPMQSAAYDRRGMLGSPPAPRGSVLNLRS